ncbi:microfibril-associated glycoprotein 4-like [Saccostrea echinata]|uniref:microfibril-associated glycoprotein 4-like n=1 Tax=Saccostrea echinata TaxID=191078 RepID=UPI002A83ED62|nr:microfibril-associated glycoprotein 4-like [Saccostrea echinata]
MTHFLPVCCSILCIQITFGVQQHASLKGHVEDILIQKTPWKWNHLNTSVKVESPLSVDISLISHYRLTKTRLNKLNILKKHRDCAAILKSIPNTKRRNGVYTIYPDMKTKKRVFCDMETDGGGWTVFLKRIDGTVNFDRDWKDYKVGFGYPDAEYWLGNEAIHSLSVKHGQDLRVDLEKFSGKTAYAKYSTFSIGAESNKYKLNVGGFSGNAGDGLAYNNGRLFTTKDSDNDSYGGNCASDRKGAWWYNSCSYANLSAAYHNSAVKGWAGVVWSKFGNENVSLKKARMMMRPKQ